MCIGEVEDDEVDADVDVCLECGAHAIGGADDGMTKPGWVVPPFAGEFGFGACDEDADEVGAGDGFVGASDGGAVRAEDG